MLQRKKRKNKQPQNNASNSQNNGNNTRSDNEIESNLGVKGNLIELKLPQINKISIRKPVHEPKIK